MYTFSTIAIGLSPKEMPLDELVLGKASSTSAYLSYGNFYEQGVGFFGKPQFGAGDVIGCGLNFGTRQLIFTKNGQIVGGWCREIGEQMNFRSHMFSTRASTYFACHF